MDTEKQLKGLVQTGKFVLEFLSHTTGEPIETYANFKQILIKSETENPWFTQENLRYALSAWAHLLTEENLKNWLKNYRISNSPKRVGLILAGNIPMVGFHDVIAVILSGNAALIKLSSKDRCIIPFLLETWQQLAEGEVQYEIVERLENFDAVIATGSNNTARYLEYYFKEYPHILRKNRTSVAVLAGNESDADLQDLAEDIFRYYGLGCRNVTRLFIPESFELDRLFSNFKNYSHIINHHKYANNYDYNKAVYLLNMEQFWDNNFVMLREEDSLFSPLSVINFSRYKTLEDVQDFIKTHGKDIQCIVASPLLGLPSVDFGTAQCPALDTYADNMDTLKFLETI